MISALRSIIRESGLRKGRLLSAIRAWPGYVSDRRGFREALGGAAADFAWGKELPILTEKAEASGGLGAYFLQDLAVARWIREAQPVRHVDVGSRIDGFIGHLAVFREVEVIDIRPAPGEVKGVVFHQLDLMGDLPDEWLGCTDSLSCLHTIEHFGLGRYGDPIDPDGYLKGLAQLKSMVAPGGMLYLSTPIGPQRIEFNAHRIFSPATVTSWFSDGWEIERCAVIGDDCKVTEGEGSSLLAWATCQTGVGILSARKTR